MLMAMAEQPQVDPRYDPAFQRGYHEAGSPTQQRPLSAGAPLVVSALQAQPVPVRQEPPAPRRSETPASLAVAPPESVASPAPVVRAPSPPWTNPFVVALAVVGVIAIAVGVWAMRWMTEQITSNGSVLNSAEGYYLVEVIVGAVPLAIAVGVLLLSAVLGFFAVHWSRTRGHDLS